MAEDELEEIERELEMAMEVRAFVRSYELPRTIFEPFFSYALYGLSSFTHCMTFLLSHCIIRPFVPHALYDLSFVLSPATLTFDTLCLHSPTKNTRTVSEYRR